MSKDKKNRFQNLKFRQQLQTARTYRRTNKNIPRDLVRKSAFSPKFNFKKVKFLLTLNSILLIYLAYFPNIFNIKHTVVEGLTDYQVESAKQTLNQYLKLPANRFLGQNSLIFLSKEKAKQYLIKNNSNILAVNSLKKDFPNTLRLDLSPRFAQFLIKDSNSNCLIVSNDGLVLKFFDLEQTSPTPEEISGLISVEVNEPSNQQSGNSFFNTDQIAAFFAVNQKLYEMTGYYPDYFTLENKNSPDFAVITKAQGPKITFGFYSDITGTLNNLRLLMSKADRKLRLAYVDMRFDKRGFVCFRNAPCARQSPEATTTPDTSVKIDQN